MSAAGQGGARKVAGQGGDRPRAAHAHVGLDRARRKRGRWTTVLVVALSVLVLSLAALGVIGFSYLQGQQKYARISESADLGGGAAPLSLMAVDWDALLAENPDTVAWLYIPGTAVNYPVVRGGDNEYYLSHDFEGTRGWLASYGAIFMDWRNNPDWSDDAYFIYGHHMNDGSMFAGIAGLADQARFDECRAVYLLSPNGNFRLRTFSLVHCPADDPLVQVTFSSKEELAGYVQDKVDRSVVDAGRIPAAEDISKAFAFATCDNFSSARYVLYAYIEEEEGTGARASAVAEESGASGGVAADLPL